MPKCAHKNTFHAYPLYSGMGDVLPKAGPLKFSKVSKGGHSVSKVEKTVFSCRICHFLYVGGQIKHFLNPLTKPKQKTSAAAEFLLKPKIYQRFL